MSECVVRMEMPKSCRECPFMTGCSYCEGYSDSCVLAPDGVECGWDFFHEEGPTKRPDWCPIICQLPEGHGRLVDAELVKEILKPVDSISHHEPEWTWGELHESNCVAIDNAPTIIPAEERSEE